MKNKHSINNKEKIYTIEMKKKYIQLTQTYQYMIAEPLTNQ